MAISKITLNGVVQIDLTSDTVTASKLFDDYTAHGADGTVVTGSYVAPTARTSSDVTVNGATVTIPAGAYSSQVQKSVASGTAGTPTASKGSVVNNSISVTPSVTNVTGYITGGTKSGTAVTVTAQEIVAGNTLYCDDSGNWNVANTETFVVQAGTAGTPSATKGTVSNHSVSVTPSVTNSEGWISSGTKTGTAVTVSASELVSGSETKTSNGTYDVTNLASLVVNVSGGSSKSISGTFTTGAGGSAQNISLSAYTGNGYPIFITMCVDEGSYDSNGTVYNTLHQYGVVMFMTVKTDANTPTYSGSSRANYATRYILNKSSNSTPNTVGGNTNGTGANIYQESIPCSSSTWDNAFIIRPNKIISIYVSDASGTKGFLPNTTYNYSVLFSE